MRHRAWILLLGTCPKGAKAKRFSDADAGLPEIQIVDRSLLISHVDVEREQVYRRQRPPTENLEESWQAVPVQVRLRGRRPGMKAVGHLSAVSRSPRFALDCFSKIDRLDRSLVAILSSLTPDLSVKSGVYDGWLDARRGTRRTGSSLSLRSMSTA